MKNIHKIINQINFRNKFYVAYYKYKYYECIYIMNN